MFQINWLTVRLSLSSAIVRSALWFEQSPQVTQNASRTFGCGRAQIFLACLALRGGTLLRSRPTRFPREQAGLQLVAFLLPRTEEVWYSIARIRFSRVPWSG